MGLMERVQAGDQTALARMATLLENDDPAAIAALDAMRAPPSGIYSVGITGPPGAGKSSLINRLLFERKVLGKRLAVLLVDPSSQATGGAVLGDRVRMLEWGSDDIFVRSQATRGQEGGLAPSTATLIDLFGHAGYDLVLLETVGVGQDGIDIRAVCDTTIVVQSPHQGDSIQSLKAGILEIADIFVVAKADLPGAQSVVRDLNAMIHLVSEITGSWTPPVIPVSSTQGTGLGDLAAAISDHRRHLEASSVVDRRRARLRWELTKRATAWVAAAVNAIPDLDEHARREDLVKMALHMAAQNSEL